MTDLRRSFDVYYRDTARTARMDALNTRFIGPGHLAFDIGAHLGDRTGSFLRLGARVVALEPQPRVFRALRLIHGRNPNAVLLQSAIGAEAGTAEFHINSANPTVSTASQDMIADAPSDPAWQDQVWDRQVTVPVTTFDALIAHHGVPDFVKLDVEGFELEAFKGLSHRLPLVSFEFTTLQRPIALACIERLARLGKYEFDFSFGEEHRLQGQWLKPTAMQDLLTQMPNSANSGDIYARLKPS